MPLPGLMICVTPSTSITSGVQKENVLSAVGFPRHFPAHLAGVAIERDDERRLAAVAAEDQEIVDEYRRAARAVLGRIGELGLLPEDVARQVEGGRAHVTEVDVDAVAVDDRRAARQAVLLVHLLGDFGIGADRFDVPENLAVGRVDAEHAERDVAGFGGAGGRGEIELAVDEHGRRPAAAGNRLLPSDILRRAPFDGHVGRRGDAIARRAAELGPVGGSGRGNARHHS